MKMLGKCLYAAAAVLLAGILLLNLWVIGARTFLHQEQPTLFGWSQAIVLSGSMEPAFSAGDLLILHRERSYGPDDIITFTEDGALITHRIVEERPDGFITRGDANNTADDSLVRPGSIHGRVAAVIPCVGNIVLFLRQPIGLMAVVLLSLLLFWGGDMIRGFGRKEREAE